MLVGAARPIAVSNGASRMNPRSETRRSSARVKSENQMVRFFEIYTITAFRGPRPTQAGCGWKRGGELLEVVKDGSLHDPQTGERVCGLAGLGAPRASLYLAL